MKDDMNQDLVLLGLVLRMVLVFASGDQRRLTRSGGTLEACLR